MPPAIGITWPSRLVPAPKGTTGTPSADAKASTRATSSVLLGEHDHVGPSRRVQAQVAAMLVEHRVAVDDAPLVGQDLEEGGAKAHGRTIVTGPSLTSSTSIRAPKTPRSTGRRGR